MEQSCNRHGLKVWNRDVSGEDTELHIARSGELALRLLIPDGEPQTCMTLGSLSWNMTEDDLRSLQTAIGWILPMIHAYSVRMGE